ncbi:unknown [Bacteroides sp. CAG:545]|nr:unknown [Bacteroides sp. CAG:545]
MEFVSLLVLFKLTFENFICCQCVCFRRMSILEILTAAVEAVSGLQVPRLHIVIDRLHVHHQFRVQVNVDCLQGLSGFGFFLLAAFRVFQPAVAVCSYPFDFLSQHREVEFGGIVTCQVAVFQPRNHFRSYLDEFLFTCDILVLDAVHLAGTRIDALLLSGRVVPRTYPPCLYLMMMVRKYLDETEFHDGIRHDIQSCTFNVKEQERFFKIQFHFTLPL